MDPKIMTEGGWKTAAMKFKIKGNDLHQALAEYNKLEDNEHDDLLASIAEIKKYALALKKSKEAAPNADLVKYLTELITAAEAQQHVVAKDKAAQAEKIQAQAKKGDAQQDQADDDDQGAKEEDKGLEKALMAAFQKLKSDKDAVFEFIVCDAKPHCGIMVAKRIAPQHKVALTKATGSKHFLHTGHCRIENGRYRFEMEKPVAGLARKLQDAIKHHTGKKLPILLGNESAEAEDSVGPDPRRPAPPPEEPAPSELGRATLEKAPEVWHHTRGLISAHIGRLKAAVVKAYADEHPEIVADIEKHIQSLDQIIENLNEELAEVMKQGHASTDPATRKIHLGRAKVILAGHIKYLKSEPLIAHIDANPFGVKIEMRKLLTERLTHMAQAIG